MEPNQDSVQFIETAPISESDREKIFQLKAEEILGLSFRALPIRPFKLQYPQ
jgi:hypothetical protein